MDQNKKLALKEKMLEKAEDDEEIALLKEEIEELKKKIKKGNVAKVKKENVTEIKKEKEEKIKKEKPSLVFSLKHVRGGAKYRKTKNIEKKRKILDRMRMLIKAYGLKDEDKIKTTIKKILEDRIKTPLSTYVSALDLVENAIKKKKNVVDYILESFENSNKKLEKTRDELLEASKEETEKMEIKAKKLSIKQLAKLYNKEGDIINLNLKKLNLIELNELEDRLKKQNAKPIQYDKDKRKPRDREIIVEKYDNPYLVKGKDVKLLDLSEKKQQRGFVEVSRLVERNRKISDFIKIKYENKNNLYLINSFIAIWYYLGPIIKENNIVSVEFTYYDNDNVSKYWSLYRDIVHNKLPNASTIGDINNIIQSLNEENNHGSDVGFTTPLLSPTSFTIGYASNTGGGLLDLENLEQNKILDLENLVDCKDCFILDSETLKPICKIHESSFDIDDIPRFLDLAEEKAEIAIEFNRTFTFEDNTNFKYTSKYVHEGFMCVTPRPSKKTYKGITYKNNCLLDCFKYVASSKGIENIGTMDNIRKKLNLHPLDPLNINDIPAIEKFFGISCCVITGKNEKFLKSKIPLSESCLVKNSEKVNVKYGNPDYCDFGIMFHNNHFSLIYSDENAAQIKKLKKKQDELDSLNHYVPEIVEQYKQRKAELEERKKIRKNATEYKYFVFSFKTIKDANGKIVPYYMRITVFGKEQKSNYIKIGSFKSCDYLNTTESTLQSDLFKFLSNKENNNPAYKNVMISFNGAKYENFILIELLSKMKLFYGNNMLLVKNRILKLNFMYYTITDVRKFIDKNFEDACSDFGIEQNKASSLNLDYTQDNNDNFRDWFDKHRGDISAETKNYNNRLFELWMKLRTSTFELIKMNLEEYVSIPQMAYKKWIRDRESKGAISICGPQEDNLKFIKDANIGPRIQSFTSGLLELDFSKSSVVQSLDIIGSYPFVQSIKEFPIGIEIKTDTYIPDKIGCYRVTIRKQPICKIVPTKIGNKYDWNSDQSSFTRNLWHVDIEDLRKHGADFTVHEGFYYEKSEKVFADYIDPLIEAKSKMDELKNNKSELYNPSLREMIKLFSTALSGKVNQKDYLDETRFIFADNQLQQFANTHNKMTFQKIGGLECWKVEGIKKNYKYSPFKAKPIQLAGLIYAYARSNIYNAILCKMNVNPNDISTTPEGKEYIIPNFSSVPLGNVFAVNTDSVHLDFLDFENLEQKSKLDFENGQNKELLKSRFGNFNLGNEIGEYKLEIPFDVKKYYLIGPGRYGAFNEKTNEERIRFSSVTLQDKILDLNEVNLNLPESKRIKHVHEFSSLDKMDQFKIYNESALACSEILFKKLINSEKVTIINSYIKRKTGGKSMVGLNHRYILKTITPCGTIIH